jgi:hypothetical protein
MAMCGCKKFGLVNHTKSWDAPTIECVHSEQGCTMRRYEESSGKDFDRAVRLGEDNVECIRGMRQWCQHFQIERTTAGMYAEMTGLPIASHKIGCSKVAGGSESMNLRWICSEFLVNYCDGCTMHCPNGDPAWGKEIIDTHRRTTGQREAERRNRAQRIVELRSHLRAESRTINADVEPESKKLINFLESLFDEDVDNRRLGSERLQHAAELAPELFPEPAIALLLTLALSEDFAELVLPILAQLAGRRGDLVERLQTTALDAIKRHLRTEQAAAIIVRLGIAARFPLDDASVESLLLSQVHQVPIGGWREGRPGYSCSTAVLVGTFDSEPESLEAVVRRHLQSDDAEIRVSLCGAVRLVQEHRPKLALRLLNDLKRSLELPEEERLSSATPSGKLTHILCDAFKSFPEQIDASLAEWFPTVRPAVQEDVVKVYRDQCFERALDREQRRSQRMRADVGDAERIAISRLLEWAKDDRLQPDIRTEALGAIEQACEDSTMAVMPRFDSLLGYCALVISEKEPPPRPLAIVMPGQQDDPHLNQLDALNRKQHWGFFKQRLEKCLEVLCSANPKKLFPTVSACLTQPGIYLTTEFKACCIALLGVLGKDYEVRPRALPLLMNALMDYESAWVRCKAIEATVEMFPSRDGPPPSNVVDTIVVHLQDPLVIVHRAALQAVSRHRSWFDSRQSVEVLSCLATHLRVYRDDKHQLKDICEALLTIASRDGRLKAFALRMIESVFPTEEEYADADIAEELLRAFAPDERGAPRVARVLATFLGKYERDRYNSYADSRRDKMFEWLHELPCEHFEVVADDLLSSAKRLAARDAWECCHFASLFSHFGAFRAEREVIQIASRALPREPKFDSFRDDLDSLAAIAETNAVLQGDAPGRTKPSLVAEGRLKMPAATLQLDHLFETSALITELRRVLGSTVAADRFDVGRAKAITDRVDACLAKSAVAFVSPAWHVMLAGLRVLAADAQCLAIAQGFAGDLIAERARLDILREHFRRLLGSTRLDMVQRAEEMRQQLICGSDVNSEKLRGLLLSVPLPAIYLCPRDNETWSRGNSGMSGRPPEPLLRVVASLDRVPVASPVLVKVDLLYPLSLRVHGLVWPKGAIRLRLDLLSTCPTSEYVVSDFLMDPPKLIDEDRYEGEAAGQIKFHTAQSGVLDDLVFTIRGAFELPDGAFQEVPVIGHHELRLRVVSEMLHPLMTGNRRLDRHLERLVMKLQQECPTVLEEWPELMPMFEALTRLLATYAQEAIFKGRSDVTEAEFQQTVLRDLRNQLGQDVQAHPNQAGGITDIRYRGVIVELKVEEENGNRQYICDKYTSQTVQYAGVESRQISLLLVLDLTPKDLPPGDNRNDILLKNISTHGGEDSEKQFPSKTFVFIVNGNTRSPSSYSR